MSGLEAFAYAAAVGLAVPMCLLVVLAPDIIRAWRRRDEEDEQ